MTGGNAAAQLRREDYKAIKHMDKAQLTEYLQRVYRRGYEAGAKAPRGIIAPKQNEASAEIHAEAKE